MKPTPPSSSRDNARLCTTLEAIRKWGITRLSARIMDIEKMTGKAPSRRRINVKNRNGRTVSVCEYWIDKED